MRPDEHSTAMHPKNQSNIRANNSRYAASTYVDPPTEANRRRVTISDLPTEVLTLIFVNALRGLGPAPLKTPWRSSFYVSAGGNTLTLMLVCWAWHDTLISFPLIWSVLTDQGGEGTLIQRSEQTPVSVVIQKELDGSRQLISHLPTLGPRLTELFWNTAEEDGTEKVVILQFPAPQLEVLYLRDIDSRNGADKQTSPELFLGDIPRLRTLHLSCMCWLPGNSFVALTHLCLQDVASTTVKFSHIFGLLRRCPLLQHLAFIGFMPLQRQDHSPPPPRPEGDREILHHLRWLSFESASPTFVEDVINLLALRQPAVVIQALNMSSLPSITLSETTLPFLSTHPFKLLSLSHDRGFGIALTASNACGSALRLSSPSKMSNPLPWMLAQLDHLPLAEIEHFHYGLRTLRMNSMQPPPGAQRVFARLQQMPCLQELKIVTDNLGAFLQMLYNGSLIPLSPDQPRLHIPTLYITVKGEILRDIRDGLETPHTSQETLPVAFDKIVVACTDIMRSRFKKALEALHTLCPLVEFRHFTELEELLPVSVDLEARPAEELKPGSSPDILQPWRTVAGDYV